MWWPWSQKRSRKRFTCVLLLDAWRFVEACQESFQHGFPPQGPGLWPCQAWHSIAASLLVSWQFSCFQVYCSNSLSVGFLQGYLYGVWLTRIMQKGKFNFPMHEIWKRSKILGRGRCRIEAKLNWRLPVMNLSGGDKEHGEWTKTCHDRNWAMYKIQEVCLELTLRILGKPHDNEDHCVCSLFTVPASALWDSRSA